MSGWSCFTEIVNSNLACGYIVFATYMMEMYAITWARICKVYDTLKTLPGSTHSLQRILLVGGRAGVDFFSIVVCSKFGRFLLLTAPRGLAGGRIWGSGVHFYKSSQQQQTVAGRIEKKWLWTPASECCVRVHFRGMGLAVLPDVCSRSNIWRLAFAAWSFCQ